MNRHRRPRHRGASGEPNLGQRLGLSVVALSVIALFFIDFSLSDRIMWLELQHLPGRGDVHSSVEEFAPPPVAQVEPPSITRGAGIRRTDGTWGPIVNTAHANTLVLSVDTESDGDIRVDFLPGGGKVIYGSAGDDESTVTPALGMDCGPSMAPDYMIIRCYDQVTGAFVPGWSTKWNGPNTNLWLLTVQEDAA